jgi:hypothetical protein
MLYKRWQAHIQQESHILSVQQKLEKFKSFREKPFDYENIETKGAHSFLSIVADIHVELVFVYHRVSLKLLESRVTLVSADHQNAGSNK